MQNPQFQLKLLLKQNSEMASKMQFYRRENQQLNQKNYDLNLWVQNLSQVFSAIGAAWKTITNNEESLYNLMKKKGDQNSKALVSKYIAHFRTFDQIISNLGEKITNSGHSKEQTIDAKTRLNAFVKNYEMFFKEFVDTYFKFNQEYTQWLTEFQKQTDGVQINRTVMNNELENRKKIKQFESFMGQFNQSFKIYQSYNKHKLLDGIIQQKNQQIQRLTELTKKQTRKINLIMDYNATTIDKIILSQNQTDYECFCGGLHLQYFKKQWQKTINQLKQNSQRTTANTNHVGQSEQFIKKEDISLLQYEKQKFFDKILSLQSRIEKIKIQNRLSEQLVLHSTAYTALKQQCQQLLNFSNDLILKINRHYEILHQIEKSRQDQINQLKAKYEKKQSQLTKKIVMESPKPQIACNSIEFKSQVTQLIKNLCQQYLNLKSSLSSYQLNLTKSKDCLDSLKKQNLELSKKFEKIQLSQSKGLMLEFRHEKFQQIEKRISQILNSHSQRQNKDILDLVQGWKDFILYVKSRDRKIKDLQSSIKKRDKDVSLKEKQIAFLQQNLNQTQKVFLITKQKLNKFQDFAKKVQKELNDLAQENTTLKVRFQQQKNLLNFKLKAEIDSKLKMQQKIKSFDLVQQQIHQFKKFTKQTQQNYSKWIQEQQQKVVHLMCELKEKQAQLQRKDQELVETQKTIARLIQEKQKTKNQYNKMNLKVKSISQNSEFNVLQVELDDYKRKIMCSCGSDREKSVFLKTCPHSFCKKCIDDTTNNRNRKCPLCGIKFQKNDIQQICWA